MASLARYASTSPDEFGRMTPVRSVELHDAIESLRSDEWDAWIELAKLAGGGR